jgi:hypothetical protein
MADAAQMAFKFFYVGSLIVNPPIIGGKTINLVPTFSLG